MDNKIRNNVNLQDAKARVTNFDEVSLGFTKEQMQIEATRCLGCKNAPCVQGCPVGVHIPQFIAKLKQNDLDGAVTEIKLTNNLPSICGRVCPQEKQCESRCVRKDKLGGSVNIGALERYVGDYALSKETEKVDITKNGKKVAVVGSGPAGLTCAADCAKAGFDVTIFEAFQKAGGVLVYGIPEFRLPKDAVVKKEIDNLAALGVKIQLNTVIGKTLYIEDLLEEFDSIFIGTGAGLPMFMNIEGEALNGVYSANEYLTRCNLMKAYKEDAITPIYRGKNVAVVGAGNVAMDSARTAMRLGAENVYVVYRRSEAEIPARHEEYLHAVEEGIQFLLLTNPIKIVGEKAVSGMVCQKMQLGELDASGRARPIVIEGSEFTIACDEVIMALGTSPNPLIKNSYKALEITKRGTIVVSEDTMQTNIENIYAGGDTVTGSATVILAMGAGKTAAHSIIEKFK
ncbi:MAG: NADPH-dependent glutamate synthase [Clostridia bacterium]